MTDRILTTRMEAHPRTHTIARYEATGGYAALRKAFGMKPEEIVAEVKASNLRGPRRADFPPG